MDTSGNDPIPMNMEQLAIVYRQMQEQCSNVKAQVANLHSELNSTKNEVVATKNAMQSVQSNPSSSLIKPKKSDSFNDKGSIAVG